MKGGIIFVQKGSSYVKKTFFKNQRRHVPHTVLQQHEFTVDTF